MQLKNYSLSAYYYLLEKAVVTVVVVFFPYFDNPAIYLNVSESSALLLQGCANCKSHFILYAKAVYYLVGRNSCNCYICAYSYNFKALFTCFQVAGSIPTAGPILRVLRNEGTPFALQAARPSRGSDDHVKWRSRLKLET